MTKGSERALIIPGRDFIPPLVADLGAKATERFGTFFTDNIRNPHTRRAYHRWTVAFYEHCRSHGLRFEDVKSYHVSAFIESLLQEGANPVTGKAYAKQSVKQALAAIRQLYDWLVVGHVCEINPAHAVRGPKYSIKKGKTPVLSDEEVRDLYVAMDTSDIVGLRDRALISMLLFTFGRVEAVTKMNGEDYFPKGKRWCVRLHEKNGKEHEMPAHSKLEAHMDAYLDAAGSRDDNYLPLFRTVRGNSKQLTPNRMRQSDVWRMVRRRAQAAGALTPIGCHSFRATGITNYMRHGGKLENAQRMANHESSRTTGLYVRTDDEIDAVEIQKVWFDGVQ